MNFWLCLFTVLLSIKNLPCEEDEFEKDDGVYVLTEANFDAFLQKYPTSLIEFYAPWCGHCKTLAPKYSEAAQIIETDLKGAAALAKVDATVEKSLGEKFQVSGYPTLKFFKESPDNPIDYDGPRDTEGIVEWVKEKADPNYKPPPSAVVVLTKDNFHDFIKTNDISLVEFYAPWCGHCKKLAPEYEKAARKLDSLPKPIPLGKVDATEEKDLATEFGVSGYPTLKIFRKGKEFEYSGPRDADGIANYMQKQSQPAAKELKSAVEAQRFLSKDDITVIGIFKSKDSPLYETFTDAAEALREDFTKMAYSVDPSVAEHFKGKPDQILYFYPEMFHSEFEPKFRTFTESDGGRKELETFIKENSIPLVGHRTRSNSGLRYSKRPLVVVYYDVDFGPQYRKMSQFWRQKVVSVAKDFKDEYSFAVSDEEEFSKELESAGLGQTGLELNVIVFGSDGKMYPWNPDTFEDEFTTENFREFMKELKKGKIAPFIKSQKPPKDDKGPVKTLVASNFDEIVNNEDKDVLIEFYAPWCGHCKKLEPIYKDLAKSLKSESDLIIGKFDATANDVPSNYDVKGFPTIYFAPSGKKDAPMKYEGGREKADLEKYLRENAVRAFKKTEL